MKILAFLIEPANYTLSIIKKVYKPKSVNYCFVYGESKASSVTVESLSRMNLLRKLVFIWQSLKNNDAFIVNSYTDPISCLAIIINLIFFKKPMAIESDTELRIPRGIIQKSLKWVVLRMLFTRGSIFGFPGGFHNHKNLFSYYGMPDDHIIVMPMMVDNSRYATLRIENRESKVFRFGCVCRLVSVKQVDKVIQAFKLLDINRPAELHIIGDGPEAESIRRAANDSRVLIHGALYGEEKVKVMQSLDCLILYSSYEPWGLVVNESLSAGIPCIVSDKVGARNDLILGNDPTGMVVDSNDVDALTEAMRTMVTDESLHSEFHANALKRMAYWNFDLYNKQFDEWVEMLKVSI